MKLIRYKHPQNRGFDSFDHLFNFGIPAFRGAAFALDEFLEDHECSLGASQQPLKMDFHENDTGYLARFELPGFSKETIDVQVENDLLTVSGREQKAPGNEEKLGEVLCSRIVVLSDAIDVSAITATYESGVLSVVLPREAEKISVSIEIK